MDIPINEPEKELARQEPIAIVEQPWSRDAVIAVESTEKVDEPALQAAVNEPKEEVVIKVEGNDKAEKIDKEESPKAESVVSKEPAKEETEVKAEPVANKNPPIRPHEQPYEPVIASGLASRPSIHKPSPLDKYRYDAPYPDTKGVARNLAYAKIIQESFSSPISEFTAASQYVFDHLVSGPQNDEISAAFEGIAIVEMEHLELLGELILELGALPFYKGDWRNKFWQGNFVKYNTNLRTMILCAISDEKKAISQYEKSIKMIKDPKINKLLERIILDEEVHIEIFKELLRKL